MELNSESIIFIPIIFVLAPICSSAAVPLFSYSAFGFLYR